MKRRILHRSSQRLVSAVALALAIAAARSFEPAGDGAAGGQAARGTPAVPRSGGISSLSTSSDHEDGLRVLGSVHVAPPAVLVEPLAPYAEGEVVVPIAYSFLFLQGSEWRTTSDGLYFRRPGETELLGFTTSLQARDGSGDGDARWEADVTIQPRDGLSWSEVDSKLDITVDVSLARVP